MLKDIRRICNVVANTVVQSTSNDKLWAMYEAGDITKEEYQQGVDANWRRARQPSTKGYSGEWTIVDMRTMRVIGTTAVAPTKG